MTIRFSGFNQLSGLSTDIKPTNVMAGFVFFETDTRILFYFDGISWTQFTGGGAGESNTASDAGSGGVGIVLPKAGVNLPFKSINAGSSKITITDDTGNNEIDIDVSESNISVGNLTGTLAINHGGTGQTTANPAFNALSPLTSLGDLLYHDGSINKRLAGNTTTTKKFLVQTGSGVISATPLWDVIAIADLPVASTSTKGVVELATDSESGASIVVQGNDSRLSDSRTPTTHKDSHKSGGSDAFISTDVLIAQSRYLEKISDPISDAGRVWINSGLLKFWDNQGSPVKHVAEVQDNKGVATGYCDLDGGALVPLSRLGGIVDANIGSHTSTKITIITKGQLNSSIGYKDESNWLTDAMVSTYTNTKITTTNKSLLNSNIVYGDQNNSLGAHYIDIAEISTPADPSTGSRRIFVDSGDGKLKVRTATGSSIDLEGGGGSGTVDNASNIGVGGVGVFDNKTDVILQFRNINAASSKISVALDSGNNEIDINVVEANLTHDNIGGTLGISKGGTGQTTATLAFNALSPSTTLGDLIYHNGTDDVRLAGNITTTKKFLNQTGTSSVSAAPVWSAIVSADLPAATTSAIGAVELATDGENAANVVVQGNDSRLSDSRTPTAHKNSHKSGGGDAFVKADILIASARYIEQIADPSTDAGRLWVETTTKNLKYWDDQAVPVKQIVEIQSNKGVASGYCDLDGSVLVPLTRLSGIADANIGVHTSTKITITDKTHLNSAILYNDVDNDLGVHYIQIGEISAPSNPASGKHRLYIDSGDNHLKKKNSAGSIKDYDASAGEANTMSNIGIGGVGVFKQKTSVNFEMKTINVGSNKVTVTDDFGSDEVDIDVVEANFTLDNIGGTLGISKGGTGQTGTTAAFNALSPSTTLGDLIYHNGTDDARLSGNTTTTKKFLTQTGDGAISASPVWNTILAADLPAATTSVKGAVELATDGENAANVVVQGNDSRLSDSRTPTAHKDSHKSGGSDTFIKSDVLVAASRYIELTTDPTVDTGRVWLNGSLLKFWDNAVTPVKQVIEVQSNKGVASGYCDLDGSVFVPLTRLSGIVDANIGSHTSSKITITDKTHLNSAILYNDVDNDLGAHYLDIAEISTPSNPASAHGRLYIKQIDSNTTALFIKLKRGGSIVEVQIG